jgi:hypothetical protein
MNMICNAVKFPAFHPASSLDDALTLVRKLAIAALLSTLESRLGFSVEPWLEGIGQVWLNRIARVAKALSSRVISFTR